MKRSILLLLPFVFFICISNTLFSQDIFISQSLDNPENEPRPVFPLPTERQVKWQETEFYAFFHYGMNTFTGKEWGYGDEDEKIYAPETIPNCLQWVQSAKAAGMKGGIAVVKHHDGFCLWPTESTNHNVLNSGGVGPSVDIPQLFSDACREENMKYGFYISPWDRNNEHYGKPEYVKDVFLKQCSELAKYGEEQFEMWFDGANGGDGYYGGANETRNIQASTYYDMPNLADSIHKLQPDCIIWGTQEARWIGNESGWAGITNWSLYNPTSYTARENGMEEGWSWLPGEADTKATDSGWFWHDYEKALPPEKLYQFYMETVGRNATLLLNIPPNIEGIVPEATVDSLKLLGELISTRLGNDLIQTARVEVSEEREPGQTRNYSASNLTDGNKNTYWTINDESTSNPQITISWEDARNVHYVMLQEHIRKGQRVKRFKIETSTDGINDWTERVPEQCYTIGYKRIVPLNGSSNSYGEGLDVKAIRITFTGSKAVPLIQNLSVF